MNRYRIIGTELSGYKLASCRSGNLARTTEGDIFVTPNIEFAEQARDYLNQDTGTTLRRTGSHMLKSLFGTIG